VEGEAFAFTLHSTTTNFRQRQDGISKPWGRVLASRALINVDLNQVRNDLIL
jgi:hypothetical protein